METKDLILLLWRNARYLVLGLLLGTILGTVVAVVEPPVYESTAKIFVSHRPQGNSDALTLTDDQLVALNLELAKAQPILDAASQALGSKIDPDAVQVGLIPNSQMIQIKIQDRDPKRAAAVANILVQTLIQQNQTLLSDRYAAYEDALDRQLDQVQAEIGDLQTRVSQATSASIQQQLDMVNQQIDQLKDPISTLRQELASAPVVSTPLERASLDEKQAQLDQLNSLLATYMQIQTNLTYIGKPAETEAGRQDPTLAALQSTLALYQQLNQNLIGNRESVEMARMQSSKTVVQLVQASPAKKPIRPLPVLYVLIGCMLGLSLAVTFVVMADHFDDSSRSASQTEKALGVEVLGSVAGLPGSPHKLVALSAPFSADSAAYLALGASVEILCPEQQARTLMVANAGPKDDATCIAANLAIINARQGKRVLLVDGDTHQPRTHIWLGIQNRDGLSELVRGELEVNAAFRPVKGAEGISFIPAGGSHKDPGKWLDPGRLSELLDQLKQRFDLVILDSPSADSADARVFAATLDAVLLAIHVGHTRIDTAQEALHIFQRMGAHVLGAVLTREPPSRLPLRNLLPWARSRLTRKRKEAHVEKSEVEQATVSSP